MREIFQPTHLLIFFVFLPAIIVPPFWMICKKAAFSPWLSLLIVVPWVNLACLYILAFSNWRTVPEPQALWSSAPTYPPSIPPSQG